MPDGRASAWSAIPTGRPGRSRPTDPAPAGRTDRARRIAGNGCPTAKPRAWSGCALVRVVQPTEHRPRANRADGRAVHGERGVQVQRAVPALSVVVLGEVGQDRPKMPLV